jgi:hypothetical protein
LLFFVGRATAQPSRFCFSPISQKMTDPKMSRVELENYHIRVDLLNASKPTLLLHSGRTYLLSILSANGIDFHQAYHGAFFTQQFFSSLINMDNWSISPHARPVAPFETGSIPSL